jgi:hypothetical protein
VVTEDVAAGGLALLDVLGLRSPDGAPSRLLGNSSQSKRHDWHGPIGVGSEESAASRAQVRAALDDEGRRLL